MNSVNAVEDVDEATLINIRPLGMPFVIVLPVESCVMEAKLFKNEARRGRSFRYDTGFLCRFLGAILLVLWWGGSTMKSIDIKSLIIGALFTSTIFLGVAATSPTDKWDNKQVWQVRYINSADISEKGYDAGWEVFSETENGYSFRRRIK